MKQIRGFFIFLIFVSLAGPVQAGQNIGALGRISPEGGIISLNGMPGDTIDQVHVSPGDRIKKGDLLVSFVSKKKIEKEVALASSRMERIAAESDLAIQIQKQRLETIKTKSRSMIALQKEKIRAAKTKLDYAQSSIQRLLTAGKDSFSAQQMEEREHQRNLSEIQMASDQAELRRLENNTSADLALGQMELNRLITSKDHQLAQAGEELEAARRNLETSDLKAPVDGTILDTLMKKGEATGGVPVIRMADLSVMTVVTDVFQADLLSVSKGMKANITSKALPKKLTGTVSRIGREIKDPSKVANVTVVLDDPAVASRLINLEVEVSILAGE